MDIFQASSFVQCWRNLINVFGVYSAPYYFIACNCIIFKDSSQKKKIYFGKYWSSFILIFIVGS